MSIGGRERSGWRPAANARLSEDPPRRAVRRAPGRGRREEIGGPPPWNQPRWRPRPCQTSSRRPDESSAPALGSGTLANDALPGVGAPPAKSLALSFVSTFANRRAIEDPAA